MIRTLLVALTFALTTQSLGGGERLKTVSIREMILRAPVLAIGSVATAGPDSAEVELSQVIRSQPGTLPPRMLKMKHVLGTMESPALVLQPRDRYLLGLAENLTPAFGTSSIVRLEDGSQLGQIAHHLTLLGDSDLRNDQESNTFFANAFQTFREFNAQDRLVLLDVVRFGPPSVSPEVLRAVTSAAIHDESPVVHARGLSLALSSGNLDHFLPEFISGLAHQDCQVRQAAIACLRTARGLIDREDGYDSYVPPEQQQPVIARWKAWAEERQAEIDRQNAAERVLTQPLPPTK